MSVSITIPIPPRSVSPNGREHHMTKAKAVKAQRAAAMILVPYGKAKKWERVSVTIRWFAARPNWIPDIDNAIGSTKGARDGLQDAGVYINDRGIETIHVWRNTDKANPRVVIEVEEVPDHAQPQR